MDRDQLMDTLASFTLFGDLTHPQLEGIVHTFEEELFPDGQRIIRRGFTGTGFYVIVEGEVSVVVDGEERARLGRGEFFGDVSVLLDEAPIADIVAAGQVRALSVSRDELTKMLTTLPHVTLRMLQATLRRLRSATQWRT
jgi:CRP-like cAMP-binding protein